VIGSKAKNEMMKTICAWCPGFDRLAANNKDASHGMCTTCLDRMMLELDRVEEEKKK